MFAESFLGFFSLLDKLQGESFRCHSAALGGGGRCSSSLAAQTLRSHKHAVAGVSLRSDQARFHGALVSQPLLSTGVSQQEYTLGHWLPVHTPPLHPGSGSVGSGTDPYWQPSPSPQYPGSGFRHQIIPFPCHM